MAWPTSMARKVWNGDEDYPENWTKAIDVLQHGASGVTAVIKR
jgi:hypothetical protein